MAKYTKEQLIAIAEKVLAQKDKERIRAKAYSNAVKALIAAHETEFQGLLEDARADLGLD